VQNSLDDDGGGVWLMIVNDMLPDLDAAATGKEVIAWSAGSWMLAKHRECVFERGSIARLPIDSPDSPGM
jgi:hypothetical protein